MSRHSLVVSFTALALLGWAQFARAGEAICGGEAALATIDGIPSYAMCTAALQSNVWSDDGVDTASDPQGWTWIETQPGGGGYQCTELASRYFAFHFGIDPTWANGDAKGFCSLPLPSTIQTSTTGVHGDLVVITPGCDGSDPVTGHIAVVDSVSGSTITAVEQNSTYNGVQDGKGTYDASCVTCFLHATVSAVEPDAGAKDAGAAEDAGAGSHDAAVPSLEASEPLPQEAGVEAQQDASTPDPYDAGDPATQSDPEASASDGEGGNGAKTGGGSCSFDPRGSTSSPWASLIVVAAVVVGKRRRASTKRR